MAQAALSNGQAGNYAPIQSGRIQQYMLVSLLVLLVLAGLLYYLLVMGLTR